MRVFNKYNDDIGDICSFSRKEIALMLKYKECKLKEVQRMIITQQSYTLDEFIGCVSKNIKRVMITPNSKDFVIEFD